VSGSWHDLDYVTVNHFSEIPKAGIAQMITCPYDLTRKFVEINVYPNPNLGEFDLDLSDFSDTEFDHQIFAQNGSQITSHLFERGSNSAHIRLFDRTPGQYYLVLNEVEGDRALRAKVTVTSK
jgi:hypothetical protein